MNKTYLNYVFSASVPELTLTESIPTVLSLLSRHILENGNNYSNTKTVSISVASTEIQRGHLEVQIGDVAEAVQITALANDSYKMMIVSYCKQKFCF